MGEERNDLGRRPAAVILDGRPALAGAHGPVGVLQGAYRCEAPSPADQGHMTRSSISQAWSSTCQATRRT